MAKVVFAVIIVILVVDFALERFLDYLNNRQWSAELPKELRDVYDAEQYRKQQDHNDLNGYNNVVESCRFPDSDHQKC